jgi:putative membrane protein
MLWLKAFHIMAMVIWVAGLFYLPRLFTYHSETNDDSVRESLKVQERKLMAATHLGAILTWLFGLSMLFYVPEWLTQDWKQIKLGLVLLLTFHYVWCVQIVRQFAADEIQHSPTWYRLFNLFPLVIWVAVVLLAVLKPF